MTNQKVGTSMSMQVMIFFVAEYINICAFKRKVLYVLKSFYYYWDNNISITIIPISSLVIMNFIHVYVSIFIIL